MLSKIIAFFLDNKLITALVLALVVLAGLITSPFDWDRGLLPSDPVAVDAIPNIGENQQIVFAEWPGRSPQDIEDQITYPLTTALVGIPGVRSIRSSSMFGFTSIYLIFEDNVEFYWSRSRVLEKLSSLPSGLLPEGVQPALGPDATALGQIFWYTLEGRDAQGETAGGWGLEELRSIQDFYVRYGLSTAEGVAEVASVGGFVKEYQIELNPDALRRYGISMAQVMAAAKNANKDVGARTFELNQVEYIIRGLGYVQSLEDLEQAVVAEHENIPIRIQDVARLQMGPAPRLGVLDKSGAEVVGGVVVARYGANPMQVIDAVKARIAEISDGLPSKTLEDGSISKLTIVPFYDRSTLIKETLGTLESALTQEILITILVVLVMVFNLRAAFLISSLLPIAVLITFVAMRYMGVEANIVALSGIAIAIGTMVDMGIVMTENIVRHLQKKSKKSIRDVVYEASVEVAPAILTAIATTIVSFLPVFALQAAEGKLFQPLAFTKTFALAAALLVTFVIIPPLAHILYRKKDSPNGYGWIALSAVLALLSFLFFSKLIGWVLLSLSLYFLFKKLASPSWHNKARWAVNSLAVLLVTWWLSESWLPLGAGVSFFWNFVFVFLSATVLLAVFLLIIRFYSQILAAFLRHKLLFLSLPMLILIIGLSVWLGFARLFAFIPSGLDKLHVNIRTTGLWSGLTHTFPGIGKEFMPALDEGSFLLMPTSMPHAGVEENTRVLQLLDMAVTSIPEVDMVVGKAGRVDSPLDPAPMSMYENVILYKPEYKLDENGRRLRFRVDEEGTFLRDATGELIPDAKGEYFRQWRDEIRSPDDIWAEISRVTQLPGVTSAPKLQPIETRLVMLQTGLRAPIGIKVKGTDLQTIESFSLELERILKEVPSVKSEAVFADRVVGKPYLHIEWDRKELARINLSMNNVQEQLEMLVGGMPIDNTVEGRERYAIRLRYPRELRDQPDALSKLPIDIGKGQYLPLEALAEIKYIQGPQMIKSEDTFLVSYVILDSKEGFAEMTVVEQADVYIKNEIEQGKLVVPAGISWSFTGNYENQVRAEQRLSILVPLVLALIFIIIYLQFQKVSTTLMIFSGVLIALSGGFLSLWLVGEPWFLNFSLGDSSWRSLFNLGTFNLSVAVWVGFIALFGIATDDGVVMATYLEQTFRKQKPVSREQVRKAVITAGMRRIRPCLMTTATTVLALLPVLTSTGKGSDVMLPMAIPIVGGMLVSLISIFVLPVLYAWWHEQQLTSNGNEKSLRS